MHSPPLAVSDGPHRRASDRAAGADRPALRAARAHARRQRPPVPGWRQAASTPASSTIGAALTSLGSDSQELLYVHMIEHLLLGDIAALLIVLGLTGPLLAPILQIGSSTDCARSRTPRSPSRSGRSTCTSGTCRPLPGGAAPLRRPRARARDVPRLRRQHVDVPVRPAADAPLVRQPRPARLHRRGAPHGDRAGQHLPVVGHGLLPLLPARRRRLSTSLPWPTRTSPGRS